MTWTLKTLIWTQWVKIEPNLSIWSYLEKVAYKHPLSALMLRNRLIDVMMKILLPACFIALKLTGSFIDFMLGLANSNVQEDLNIVTSQVRDPRIISYDSNHIELFWVRDNTNIMIHVYFSLLFCNLLVNSEVNII